MIDNVIQLNNNVTIPTIGFGTAAIGSWQQNDSYVTNIIKTAIESGYSYIDTSSVGGNEGAIGKAIKEADRSKLFIASKVWNADQGYDQTLRSFDKSINLLGLDVIDLYLIHWPVAAKTNDTWKAMEHLYKQGRVRAIGVSNFRIQDLEALSLQANIPPACNQIELHPYFSQVPLRKYCAENNICVIAWAPLGTGSWSDISPDKKAINNLIIQDIASKHQVSAAQIILRWNINHGIIPVPKSENTQRIKQNISLDDVILSEDDMIRIDSLNKDLRLGPNPGDNGAEKYL